MTDKTIIEEIRGIVWKTIYKHCRCCDWSKHAYDDELADWLLEQITLAEKSEKEKTIQKIEFLRDKYRLKYPGLPTTPMPSYIRESWEDLADPFVAACNQIISSLKQSPDFLEEKTI